MKFTAPHWIIAILTLLIAAAPQVAQQFPAASPWCNLFISIGTIVLGVLGGTTASVIKPKDAAAVAAKVAGSTLMLGALVLAAAGLGANCQAPVVSPQTQAQIQAAEQLGACIEGVYAADSQKVPAVTPVQIAIDEGLTCGADLQNLIDAFGTQPTKGQQDVIAAAQEHSAEFANAKLRHSK